MEADFIVVGGGAAGYFAALNAAENNPQLKIIILEAGSNPLAKVLISGGGRCNVTHHQYNEALLVEAYPRGKKELRGPFTRFGPEEMVNWLLERGVQTVSEADGRMFPATNKSTTIIQLFEDLRKKYNIQLQKNFNLKKMKVIKNGFQLLAKEDRVVQAPRVLLATGSAPSGYRMAKELGHNIVPPLPSLFTFNMSDPLIKGLQGISFEEVKVQVKMGKTKHTCKGPLLITHWGLSGPAVLKLSSIAARALAECKYQFTLEVDFLPQLKGEQGLNLLTHYAQSHKTNPLMSASPFGFSRRFWQALVEESVTDHEKTWAHISKKEIQSLYGGLKYRTFDVSGKAPFKEEFVTSGGVDLKEVNFKTMESKKVPGLYFAGEVLNIDGITGGFNFQSAWTTGYHVALAL